MKDIKLEKEILDFFNKVKDADEIKDKIIVDPKFKKRGLLGIGGGIKASDAKRIMDFRESLPNKEFQYIEQIENINKVSLRLFNNILYTFGGTYRSEKWDVIIGWFKKNRAGLDLDRFQRVNQIYIEGSIVIDYQKIPLTVYTAADSENWELRLDIEQETSISSFSEFLKAFGGTLLKKIIPPSIHRIGRVKILEFKCGFSPEDNKLLDISVAAQTEKSWKLLTQRLPVYNSVIQLDVKTGDEVFSGKVSASIEGFLRAGKIDVPVTIKKKYSEDKWTLTQRKKKAVFLGGLVNIERLWGRLSLSGMFPRKIIRMQELKLSNMRMEFSDDLRTISYCRALVSSSQPLSLAKKGLVLDHLNIDLEVKVLPDFERVVHRSVSGGFKVKDDVVSVVFHIPENKGSWIIKTDPRQDFYEISAQGLGDLLNDYQIETFLPNFEDIENISVKEYAVWFSPDTEIPEKISITLGNIKSWKLIPGQLSLHYAEAQVTLDDPVNLQAAGVSGAITGDILIGSSDYAKLPVVIKSYGRTKKWRLTKRTDEMVRLPANGMLLGLPGREEFIKALPDSIDPIAGLTLSDMEMTFSSGFRNIDVIYQTFRSVKGWEIIKDWHIQGELTVKTAISGFEDDELSVKGSVDAFLKVKDTEFYFTSPLPTPESGLVMHLREPIKNPSMSDLALLIGEDDMDNIVPGTSDFSGANLSDLTIAFDPEYKTISSISLKILSNSQLPILENDLILENSEINLILSSPLTSEKSVEGEITGDLPADESGDVIIPVKITISDGEPEWSLELAGEKPVWTPTLQDISNLIQGKDFADFLLPSFIQLNDFSISELKIVFDVHKKLFSSLFLQASTEDSWKIIGDGWLPMEEISVKLDMGDISVPDYSYQGEISGKLSAQDTKIPVKFSLPLADGKLALESAETKANKIADVSLLFGDYKLEDFLPNLDDFRDFSLSDLKIQFNDELNEIERISFLIALQEKWFVIPDELFVDGAEIRLGTIDPLDSDRRIVHGNIVGVLKGNNEKLDIPVEIEVSSHSDSWPLSASSQSSTAYLSSISGLPGGESLLSILPPIIVESENLDLVSMEMGLLAGFADIPSMELRFELENEWVLAPGMLTFRQTEISLNISKPLSPVKFPDGVITGEIVIGDDQIAFPISLSISDSGSDRFLKLTNGDDIIFVRHISNLSLLPGFKQLLEIDPYSSLEYEKARITSLEIEFQPYTGYISRMNYALELEDEWNMIPERLIFKELKIDLEVIDPFGDDFEFKESVTGILKNGSLEIPARFEHPESDSSASLLLNNTIEAENSSGLYSLTPDFKFGDLFANWNDDLSLNLLELDIGLDSDYKNIDRVFWKVALIDDLSIDQGFVLKSASLELYMSLDPEAEEKVRGTLAGYLSTGTSNVRIPVELPITYKKDFWNFKLDKDGFDAFAYSLSDLERLTGDLPKTLSNLKNYRLSKLDMEISDGLSKVDKAVCHLDNNGAWEVVPGWIPLSYPGIRLVLENASGRLEVKEGRIEGQALVGDSLFPLETTLPYSPSGLALRLPGPLSLSGFDDLSKLANFDLSSFLPGLSSVDDLNLEKLEFYPDEQFKHIERINFTLSSDSIWSVVPEWLSFSDMTAHIAISCYKGGRTEAKGLIIGNMQLGGSNVSLPAEIEILPSGQDWIFSSGADFSISMEKLAKLRLAGRAGLLDVLPGRMGYAKGMILHDLKIEFSSLTREASLLSFSINSAQAWNIVPDWFPLLGLDGRIEIEKPTAAMSIGGQFSGAIKLGSTIFKFHATLPMSTSGLSLILSEKTIISEVGDLSWLLGMFDIESDLPLAAFSNMEASELELKIDSSFNSIYSLSMKADLPSSFALPGGQLTLDNVSVSLKATRLSEFNEDISASIRGELLVEGQEGDRLPALATLDRKNNLWTLEVETNDTTPTDIGVFFQKMGLSSPESFLTPATLKETISLKNLTMEFTSAFGNLSKANLTVQVGADWKINEDLPAMEDIETDIEIEEPFSDNPVVRERIRGSIRIGNYKLLVAVAPESSSSARLSLRQELTFVDVDELSLFLELFNLKDSLRTTSGFPNASLSRMDMSFDFSANLIDSLSLRLDTGGKYWKRIGEIFRVYGDEINIEVARPLEKEKSALIDIKGRVLFKGRDISVIVSQSSDENAYLLRLDPEANFRFDEADSLLNWVKQGWITDRLPASLAASGEIGLSDLRASIDPKGRVSSIALDFSLLDSWRPVKNWMPLNRTEIQIEIDRRNKKTFSGNITGTMNVGDTALKLQTEFSSAKGEYVLNLVEAAKVGKIADLDMLADGLRVGEYLYDVDESFDATLESFAARFDPTLQTLSDIFLSLKLDGEWIGFSETSLPGAGYLDLEISRPLGKDRAIVTSIRAKLLDKETNLEIPVKLNIREESETWLMRLDSENAVSVSDLSDFSRTMGLNIEDFLPSGLNAIKGLELIDFSGRLSLKRDRLLEAAFDFASLDGWYALEGYPLRQVSFSCTINNFLGDDPQLDGRVTGFLDKGEVALPVRMSINSRESGYRLELVEKVSFPDSSALFYFIDESDLGQFASCQQSLSDVSFTDFQVVFDSGLKEVRRISLNMEVGSPWHAVPQYPPVLDAVLSLEATFFSGGRPGFDIRLDGRMSLVSVGEISVEGRFDVSKGAWTLRMTGEEVELGSWESLESLSVLGKISGSLPKDLRKGQNPLLSALEINASNLSGADSLGFEIKLDRPWKVLPKWTPEWRSISEMTVQGQIDHPLEETSSMKGDIFGVMAAGKQQFPVRMSLPVGEKGWLLQSVGTSSLSGDIIFGLLLERFKLIKFLPGASAIKNFEIRNLEIEFDRNFEFISSLTIDLNFEEAWSLIPKRLLMNKGRLFLEIESLDGAEANITGFLNGNLSAGKKSALEIPVTVNIASFQDEWDLRLNSSDPVHITGRNDLDHIVGKTDILNCLPGDLADSDFILDDFLVYMAPASKKIASIEFSLKTARLWKASPNWYPIHDINIDLFIDARSSKDRGKGELQGNLRVGTLDIPVFTPLPGSGSEIFFKRSFQLDSDPQATVLFQDLYGKEFLSLISKDSLVSRTEILFDSDANGIGKVSSVFESEECSLIPQKLIVKNAEIGMETENFLEAESLLKAVVKGTMSLGKISSGDIPVTASTSDVPGEWTLKLAPGKSFILSNLGEWLLWLGINRPDDYLPEVALEIQGVELDSMEMKFSTTEKKITSASCSLNAVHNWKVPSDWEGLNNLDIELFINYSGDGSERLLGEIRGIMALGNARLPIIFDLPCFNSGPIFRLAEDVELSIADFFMLRKDLDWEKYLPGFSRFEKLSLSDLNIELCDQLKTVRKMHLSASANESWNILREELSMKNLTVELEIDEESSSELVSGTVKGTHEFSLDNQILEIPMIIDMSERPLRWLLNLDAAENIGLDECNVIDFLKAFLPENEFRFAKNDDLIDSLIEIANIRGLELSGLEIESVDDQMDYIYLLFQKQEEWNLIRKRLTIHDTKIRLELDELSEDFPMLNASVSGFVKNGKLELPVYASLSPETFGLTLELAERTKLSKASDLYLLLDENKIQSVPNLDNLRDVHLDKFDLEIDSGGDISWLSFDISGFENWELIPQTLSLSEGGLSLSLTSRSGEDGYEVEGEIDGCWLPSADSNLMPITATIHESGLDWELKLKPGFHVLQSEMSDLVRITTGSPLFSLLPAELDSISGVILDNMQVRFYPEERITFTSFNLKTAYTWECIPGLLPLGELNIRFDITEPMSSDRELKGAVQGALFLGGTRIPVSFELSYSDWRLELTEETALAHISDFDVILGDFDLRKFFPGIGRLSNISLSDFGLQINPFSKVISLLSFSLNVDNLHWSVGKVGLRRVAVSLDIQRPLESDREIIGAVHGNLPLNEAEEVHIPIEINIDGEQAEEWPFSMTANDSDFVYALSELEELFENVEVFGVVPPRFKESDDFRIVEFSGLYSRKLERIESFSIKLSGDIWQIVPDWFSFADVEIEAEVKGPDEIGGAISGKVKTGESEFSLYCPLSSSPADFRLGLKEKTTINRIDELSRFLGNFELETLIPNIELLPELIVSETDIRFADDFSEVETQFINLEIPEEAVWQGIPDRLALSGASMDLFLRAPFTSQREVAVEIKGTMLLEEGAAEIPIFLSRDYGADGYRLTLDGEKEVRLSGTSALKGLSELDFLKILPDDLRRTSGMKLLDLSMTFNSSLSQLSADFSVELMNDWKPISKWLPLKRVVLGFGIDASDVPAVTADIEGFIEAGDAELKVGARFLERSPEFQLALKESAILDKVDDLSSLLGDFKWEKFFPGFDRVQKLGLLNLIFQIRPELGTVENCFLRLTADDSWPLIGERFPLGDFKADLEITTPLSIDKNIRSRVEGSLTFGASEQLKVPVLLTLPSSDSDWTVQLGGRENIIPSRLEYIEELLGDIEPGSYLPDGISSTEGMTVTDFRMALPLSAEKAAVMNARLHSVKVWEIIPDWIPMNGFAVNLNVMDPGSELFSAEGDIQTMIQLGDVLIPVNGSLSFSELELSPGEEVLITSLRDLSRMLPETSLEKFFPGLSQVEHLTLSGLRASFDKQFLGLERIYLSFKYSGGWDVIPGALTIYDGQLELEMDCPQDSEKTFVAEIRGNLKASPDLPPNIPARIDINDGETCWRLQLGNQSGLVVILPGLKNLSKFFGPEEVFMSLPDEILEIEGFALSALEAEVYPDLKKISELSFVMETVYSFEPVAGLVIINNVEMSFSLDRPLSPDASCRAEVRGLIKQNDLELPLKASLFKSDLVFKSSEVVSQKSLADLSALMNDFDFGHYIPGYEEISSYSINEMEMEWDLKFEEIKRVSLQLTIPGSCSLAADQLTLTDAVVNLSIDRPWASYSEVKGTIAGLARTDGSNFLSVPVVIDINSRLPFWKMEFVDLDKVETTNWQELKSLPGGTKWSSDLHPDLRELRELKLESGNALFKAGFESIYKSTFEVTAEDDWSLAENLTLSGLNIDLEITEPSGDSEVRGGIKGWIALADMEAPLIGEFPKPSLKFALDTRFHLPLYNLTDISKIGLEVKLDKYLPGLSQVDNLHLSGLEMDFYPDTKIISALRLEIKAEERWNIADNLNLDDSKVNVTVLQSKDHAKSVEAQVKGTIPKEYVQEIHSKVEGIVPKEKFTGSAFPVAISIDDDNRWKVKLDSEVTVKLLKFENLRQLPGSDVWLECAPHGLKQVKEWQVFGFSFDFLPATKEFSNFKLSAASQACWHVLTNSYLKFKELKLELGAENFKDGRKTVTGKLQGTIALNKIFLPATVSLPLENDELRFDLDREISLFNISELSFLSDKMDLKELLADLPESNGVVLSDLSVVCDKRLSRADNCRMEIKLKESWRVADNLEFEDVVIRITTDFSAKDANVKANVAAFLTTENNRIPVKWEALPDSEDWFVKLDEQAPPVKANLREVSDYKTLFNLGNNPPENFYNLKGLMVSKFALVYLPAENELFSMSFKLETFDCWDIVPDWFTVSDLSLQAVITNPMTPDAVVEGEINGTIQIGETNIGVKVPLPFGTTDLSLSLARDDEFFSRVKDFGILAGEFYSPEIFSGYDDVPKLSLTALNVEFDLILNRVAELSFALLANDSWEIVREQLTIRETSAELTSERYAAGGVVLKKENIEGFLTAEKQENPGMPVAIERNGSSWILSKNSSEDFPLDMFGGQSVLSDEDLSKTLSAVNIGKENWSVRDLAFAFPLNRQRMDAVSCLLASSEDWEILPGRFIKNLNVRYESVDFPNKSSVSAKISGLMSAGESELPVCVFPLAGEDLIVQLDKDEMELSEKDLVELFSLTKKFDVEKALPGIEKTDGLLLYQMELEADRNLGDFGRVLFKLRNDNKWQIIRGRFSLSKVDIRLESSGVMNFQKDMEINVKANLMLGKKKNKELPVELSISPDDSQWRLSLTEESRYLFNSVSELSGIIENLNFPTGLPDSFGSVGDIEVSGLEILFSRNLKQIKTIGLDLKTLQTWEFIKDCRSLYGISARIQSSPPLKKPTPIEASVKGSLQISSSDMPMEISPADSDGQYNLRLLEKTPINEWKQVLRVFDGSEITQTYPPYPPFTLGILSGLKDFSLSSLSADFKNAKSPAKEAHILFESDSSLKLLDNFSPIDKVKLSFEIKEPLKLSSSLSGKIDGLIVIEEEPLLAMPVVMDIGKPGVQDDLELLSEETVTVRRLSQLDALLGGVKLLDYLPNNLERVGPAALSDLKLVFGPDKVGELNFNVQFDEDWILIPDEIVLSDLQLRVEADLKSEIELKANATGLMKMDDESFEIEGVIETIENDWLLRVRRKDDSEAEICIVINSKTGLVKNVVK